MVRDEGDRPPNTTTCPEGHPIVQGTQDRPAFPVVIGIVSAAYVGARDHVVNQGRYHLLAFDLDRVQELTSARTYLWAEAIALAEKLKELPDARAWALWDKLKP